VVGVDKERIKELFKDEADIYCRDDNVWIRSDEKIRY